MRLKVTYIMWSRIINFKAREEAQEESPCGFVKDHNFQNCKAHLKNKNYTSYCEYAR
jgi:hypothetical protein